MKARPIAPATKHPMSFLLKKAGRAWYFLATHYGQGFNIPNVSDIPNFFKRMREYFGKDNDYTINTYDIEGCFPHMPKAAIFVAMNDIVAHFKHIGKTGVWVPNGKKQCTWNTPKKGYGRWLPWDVLIDVFA